MVLNGKNKGGFTLVESIVAVAIFALLAGVIYQTSALLVRSIGAYRENTAVASLANEYMEIVHNLPYSDLSNLSDDVETSVNGNNYKIHYTVKDTNTDYEYKQVKLYIENLSTNKIYTFSTNITPKNIENTQGTGTLLIQVIDANGQPVPNATIDISNTLLSPNINLTGTTDTDGHLMETNLATSSNSYHIAATKSGYSSDQTYPITGGNPNPTKPDSTIVNGQITKVSLAIDKLSALSFYTLDQNCQVLPDLNVAVRGAKLIGSPNLLKFDRTYISDALGKISLSQIEWDNYTSTLTDNNYMLYGSSPQLTTLQPNTSQSFNLILGPKTADSLLALIKDSFTGNPIEGATVELQNNDLSFTQSKTTGDSINTNGNSDCFTPGQVIFTNLTQSSNYNLLVSAPNYSDWTIPISIVGNKTIEVNLNY
jgi:prepilin-type N-terminal cleavage/methylation domain-containing protein